MARAAGDDGVRAARRDDRARAPRASAAALFRRRQPYMALASAAAMNLHVSQRHALDHITSYARTRKAAACQTLSEILAMANITPEALDEAVAGIKQHARIALHFHPDRPGADLHTVAHGLHDSGVYKSQFETLLSNGSVTAYAGGARDRWEAKLFGGAYQLEGTTAAHRPKYGALDLLHSPDGPAPRFGSCYVRLKPAVSARATFTYLDSYQDPPEKGTYEELDDIVAALFAESFTRDFAIGAHALSPTRLLAQLTTGLAQPFADPSARPASRNLNHYIEAQVHGEIRLSEDAEAIVADPSFRGSETGALLEALCARYGLACWWHGGFVLRPDEVPSDFRGPRMPSLAARVAEHGVIDAAAIGRAAVALKRDAAAWADRGSEAEVLQELKLLWHVLARFGRPYREGAAAQ